MAIIWRLPPKASYSGPSQVGAAKLISTVLPFSSADVP